ncbi:MAG: hypothetical protein AB7O21_08070 [Gammaproteobacteria bacterium]
MPTGISYRRLVIGVAFAGLCGTAVAAQYPVSVEQGAEPTLRIVGAYAQDRAGGVRVQARVKRSLRTHLMQLRNLKLELRGPAGDVREQAAVVLSPVDLPRRSIRQSRFTLELTRAPASDETLVLVMNPRQG